jgi:hypothetical protein
LEEAKSCTLKRPDFNSMIFIKKKNNYPPEAMLETLKDLKKVIGTKNNNDEYDIEDPWAYACTVLKRKSQTFNAEKHIKESKSLNNEANKIFKTM